MDRDLMLKTIDQRGGLGGRERALEAAGAVLSVLGERLAGGEPADWAAQLAAELAGALPLVGAGETVDVEELDRRVAQRERGRHSPDEAHRHAVAVLTTVLEAVSPGEQEEVAAQLPTDYDDFLPPWSRRRAVRPGARRPRREGGRVDQRRSGAR